MVDDSSWPHVGVFVGLGLASGWFDLRVWGWDPRGLYAFRIQALGFRVSGFRF